MSPSSLHPVLVAVPSFDELVAENVPDGFSIRVDVLFCDLCQTRRDDRGLCFCDA